jgi:hypothetical protein
LLGDSSNKLDDDVDVVAFRIFFAGGLFKIGSV